jgi:hypothetical protein
MARQGALTIAWYGREVETAEGCTTLGLCIYVNNYVNPALVHKGGVNLEPIT